MIALNFVDSIVNAAIAPAPAVIVPVILALVALRTPWLVTEKGAFANTAWPTCKFPFETWKLLLPLWFVLSG